MGSCDITEAVLNKENLLWREKELFWSRPIQERCLRTSLWGMMMREREEKFPLPLQSETHNIKNCNQRIDRFIRKSCTFCVIAITYSSSSSSTIPPAAPFSKLADKFQKMRTRNAAPLQSRPLVLFYLWIAKNILIVWDSKKEETFCSFSYDSRDWKFQND